MSHGSWLALRVSLGALTAALVAAPAASAAELKAGVAKVDATWKVGAPAGQYASGCEESLEKDVPDFDNPQPPPGDVANCPLVGDHGTDPALMGAHRAPSYGVQSRLDVRALVVEGPGGKRWALVKNDLYIPQDMLWRRTAQILEGAGSKISQDSLTMAVSHDHSSPYQSSISWGVFAFQDKFDARFFEYYAQRMAQAVQIAESRLVKVRMGAAVAKFDKTHGHSFGPTVADDGTPAGYPYSDVDTDLPVIRFDDISDAAHPKPLAILISWGGHPEMLNGNNLITADYIAPLERIVDRGSGAMLFFTQGDTGTKEPERSRFHSVHERLEFNHREYGQAEYAGYLLGNTVLDTFKGIESGTPPDAKRYIPFTSSVGANEFGFENRWFPGPVSHQYPGVSNCRTERAFQGNPGVPVVGLPDCDRTLDGRDFWSNTGVTIDTFKDLGIPVPENYSAPGYTGLEEDVNVHLQALRIGDLLLTICSCEQWKDQALNIKTRTDRTANNEWLGLDWYQQCEKTGATWTCPDPRTAGTTKLTGLSDRYVKRMHAQVVNKANGWNDPDCTDVGCGFRAEEEPNDPAKIRGNYTHDDDAASAGLGYKITATIGMANDYNGYIATYREYQRGDHYRKALTAWGPHSSDYMATRLVQMGRHLKNSELPVGDAGDDAIGPGKTAIDNAHNDGRVAAMGELGKAALTAWQETIPDSAGAAAAIKQPGDIERFDATFFQWSGGDNYTDQPDVRVQRKLDGAWRDFADQSGEVPVHVALPSNADLPSFLPAYFGGAHEWHWTATFEAFASYFDTGGVRATPEGTYRFVVDGFRREGHATKPYHLESNEFGVRPWSGITVEDLKREDDGSVSFRAGPQHTVKAYNIGVTEDLRDRSQTNEASLEPRQVALGPVDYPDTYTDAERADFVYNLHGYRVPAGSDANQRLETYCFTCSFRPWADYGDAVSATFTVVGADGSAQRLDGVRRADGRWATPRPLGAGELAFVASGDVCDGWGNTNGGAALIAGTSLPAGVPTTGTNCKPATAKAVSDTEAPTEPVAITASDAPAELAPATSPSRIGEPGGGVLGVRGKSKDVCLPKSMRFSTQGLGRARLGASRSRIESVLPARGEHAGRTLAYCVRGGGLVVVVFSARGKAQMIVSTARRHQAGHGAGPGDSKRAVTRAYRGAKRSGGKLIVRGRGSRLVFAIGPKGVRYVAVMTGSRGLGGYLKQAGFLR